MTNTPHLTDRKTETIRLLATALRALMEDEGGEPQKGDPRSAARWHEAQKALDRAQEYLTDAPTGNILSEIPRSVMRCLRDEDLTDDEILRTSPRELFRKSLQWRGIIGYADTFWDEVLQLHALEGRLPQ